MQHITKKALVLLLGTMLFLSTKSNAQCYSLPTAPGVTINCGESTGLFATGQGSNFFWYDVPTGGVPISIGQMFVPSALTQNTTYYVETNDYTVTSDTFNYTGTQATFTVPAGITEIEVDMYGAQGAGGNYTPYTDGGLGGRVRFTMPVTPGNTYILNVGGQGVGNQGGFNGGGGCPPTCNSINAHSGGGSSDIRLTLDPVSRLAVAGGGGGAGYWGSTNTNAQGGAGGGLIALDAIGTTSSYLGKGGTQSAGGIAGSGNSAGAGAFFQGGVFPSTSVTTNYGGGGGGYYGGGAGWYTGSNGGGGGGGSSYTDPSYTDVIHDQGVRQGNGMIVISYGTVTCSSDRLAVPITVVQNVFQPIVAGATVMCGDTVNLVASGSVGLFQWYDSYSSTTPIAENDTLTYGPVLSNTTFYVRSVDSYSNPVCVSNKVAVLVQTSPVPIPTSTPFVNVQCGGSTTLTASGSTGNYVWFDAPTGGNMLGKDSIITSNLFEDTSYFYVEATSNAYPYALDSIEFAFTGSEQTWTVPAGIDSIEVELYGASGKDAPSNLGGLGGSVTAKIAVTPGEVLNLYVGGTPTNYQGGYNGGGSMSSTSASNYAGAGGGATDIRIGGSALADRVIVAGGGGGGGYYSSYTSAGGGDGGGLTGADGQYYSSSSYRGGGGTQTAGGYGYSYSGSLGNGGTGYYYNSSYSYGAGGGGYYGGGGGGRTSGSTTYLAGGGGGSSYTSPTLASNVVHTQGVNTGDGKIKIKFLSELPYCSSQRAEVAVITDAIVDPTTIGDTVVCSDSTMVFATGSTGYYRWFKNINDIEEFSTSSSINLINLQNDTTLYVEAVNAPLQDISTVFNYTGSEQTWTVPEGVYEVEVELYGAQGGTKTPYSIGGLGGLVTAKLAVTPGEVLNIYVGSQPTNYLGGYNGGGTTSYNKSTNRGGGGATDIRIGGSTYNERIIVAGGGGGTGDYSSYVSNGGDGGDLIGGNGQYNSGLNTSYCGQGGTQSTGGIAATYSGASAGSFGEGGIGGYYTTSSSYGVGGGGGGWYGGGGGSYQGGGGGGSSYADPSLTSNVAHTQGAHTGDGQLIISYRETYCASNRVPVSVIVNNIEDPIVTPVTVNCGTSAVLSAASNFPVKWFNNASDTIPFAEGNTVITSSLINTDTVYVQAYREFFVSGETVDTLIEYTGAAQTWTVPENVYEIEVELYGAQGGTTNSSRGGYGAKVSGKIAVTPGEVLQLNVGQQPISTTGGWNGGGNGYSSARGGGGATDIRLNGTTLNDRIIVAGAGGGGGYNNNTVNERGGAAGGAGVAESGYSNSYGQNPSYVGGGASQTAGGPGSTSYSGNTGTFGEGASPGSSYTSGGGGAGWYGGGSGGYYSGGGGGSSYADPTYISDIFYVDGITEEHQGHGMISIQYVEKISNICESNLVPYILFVDSLQAPTVIGGTTICYSGGTTFTASGGTGTYNWYENNAIVSNTSGYTTGNRTTSMSVSVNYVTAQGCVSSFASDELIIVDVPAPTITANPDSLCVEEGTVQLATANTGGTWSGNGIDANGIFDPLAATVGTHTVYYEMSANGCTATDSVDIEVITAPVAQITTTPQTMCITSATVSLQATTTSGTWSGPGVVGSTFDGSVMGAGIYEVVYSETNGNCSSSDTVELEVVDLPIATIVTAPNTYCSSDADVALQAAQSGGTWSGNFVNNGIFEVSTATAGSHTIYYDIITNGCSAIDSVEIEVLATPIAQITTAPQSVCVSAATVSLQASTATGTWSGTGVTGSTFDGSALTAGIYEVVYSETNGSCSSTDTVEIEVLDLPDASIVTAPNTYCSSDADVALQAAQSGGTWSGNFVNNGTFEVSTATAGMHTIYYNLSTGGCSAIDSVEIEVLATPIAQITTAPQSVCVSAATVSLQASTATGTWSGTGVTGSTFDGSALTAGIYEVVYSETNGSCSSTDTVEIEVLDLPDASIVTAPNTYCSSDADVALQAAESGGTWSGNFVNNGTFEVSTATAGMHTIYYNLSAGGCSAIDSVEIEVLATPIAQITTAPQSVCVSAATVSLQASTATGTWSGTGVTGSTFDGSALTAGIYEVVYSETNGSCSSTDTVEIEVLDLPDASIVTAPNTYCSSDADVALQAAQSGGTWSGNFVNNGTFEVSTATAGMHTIYYNLSAGGCSAIDSVEIEVLATPIAQITTAPQSVCVSAATVSLQASTATGTWSGTGVTGSTFDGSALTAGIYEVVYSETNGSCSSTDTVEIEVLDLPDASIVTAPNTYCSSDADVALQAAESGGTWSGNFVNNGIFEVSTATAGMHTIYYNLSAGGCSAIDSVEIEVLATPIAQITTAPQSVCVSAATVSLQASTATGTWSGTGVTGSTFDGSALTAGIYEVVYSETNGSCSSTDTVEIEVLDLPDASIVTAPNTYCSSDADVALQAAQSGGTWSGNFVNNGTFEVSTATAGMHTIYYNLSAGGCSAIDSVEIEVLATPIAQITTAPQSVCVSAATVSLQASTATGTWSGTGVTGSTFDGSALTAGIYEVVYSETNGSCSSTDTVEIEVLDLPDASIVTAPNTYCSSDADVALQAAQSGGTWSGNFVNNGIFEVSTATAGMHTIYYNLSAGGCSAIDSVEIEVLATPIAQITIAPQSVCVSAATVSLQASTATGTWSGTGVTGSTFDGSALTAGIYEVVYSESNGNCSSSDTVEIEVVDLPNATIIDPASAFCSSETSAMLQVVQTGGTWTGNYVNNGVFDIVAAGVGTHTVYYELIENGCSAMDSTIVEVNTTPTVAFANSNVQVCADASVMQLQATPSGGTWAGSGIVNGANGTFNPGFASVGNHEVTYTVTENGCSAVDTMNVQVASIPTANFIVDNGCTNVNVNFTDVSTNAGSGITNWNWNFGDGTTSSVQHPSTPYAQAGSYIVTLQVSTPAGCSDLITQTVQIGEAPDASFNADLMGDQTTVNFYPITPEIGADYLWTFGDGYSSMDINAVHAYAVAGAYTACLTVEKNGCSQQTCSDVITTGNVGVADLDNESFNVYPNPFTNNVTIELGQISSQEVSVSLYDVTGKLVMEPLNIANGDQLVSLQLDDLNLVIGTYYLVLDIDGLKRTKVLIKQ